MIVYAARYLLQGSTPVKADRLENVQLDTQIGAKSFYLGAPKLYTRRKLIDY